MLTRVTLPQTQPVFQGSQKQKYEGKTSHLPPQAQVHFSGKSDKDTSNTRLKRPLTSRFKLPMAMMWLSALAGPINLPISVALAQQTASVVAPMPAVSQTDRDKLVAALDTDDEQVVAAALWNLAAVNERRAIPTIERILSTGEAEQDTLQVALLALGELGSQGSAEEQSRFSRQIMPYLLKVIVEDKDGNARFVSPEVAQEMVAKNPDSEIKDLRADAARALGRSANPATVKHLVSIAQSATQDLKTRSLALESLKYATGQPEIHQQLAPLMDEISPAKEPGYVAKTASLLVEHEVPNIWGKLEQFFNTLAELKYTSQTDKEEMLKIVVENDSLVTIAKKEPKLAGDFSEAQVEILQSVLRAKKLAAGPMMTKQLVVNPGFFGSQQNFAGAIAFFKSMGPETQQELLKLSDPIYAEKQVRAALPQDVAEDPEQQEKIKEQIQLVSQLSLAFSAAIQNPKAAETFQKIFMDPTKDTVQRQLAIVGSTLLKDKTAIEPLLQLATSNTENPEFRYDALAGVFDILSPPLDKEADTDTRKFDALQKYLMVYSKHPEQFKQSFFLSEIFNEVRDTQKQLLRANAPAAAIAEATDMIVENKLNAYSTAADQWAKLLNKPELQKYQQEMLKYVRENNNADGFLRVLMVSALGASRNAEVSNTLEEMIKDPLIRVQIDDLYSCNDMMNFPGYTKSVVADAHRLAAIEALEKVGGIHAAELIEKGTYSDDRQTHYYSIKALAEIGKNTRHLKNPELRARREALGQRILERMPTVDLEKTDRLNTFFMKLYAEAADQLGFRPQLLEMLKAEPNPVIRRAIANGLITNDQLSQPDVAQHLLSNSLNAHELHKQGIDGRGTEIAIIDGDYINRDLEGMEGKVVYPKWGHTKDAALRESFHGESVAAAISGKHANVMYGLAPGVEKIHSYAAWDDFTEEAGPNAPVEETDGMLRAIDDIIQKRLRGESNVSVVNMSLGGTAALLYADEVGTKIYLDKLAAHIEAASKLGISFVISAGNERGEELRHYLVGTLNALGFSKKSGNLAETKGVILVGATDTQGSKDRKDHKMSWFSSMGDPFNPSQPDLVAPGTNIPLASREADGSYGMDEMDGTSFSAPITAAALLLMQQVYGGPIPPHLAEEIFRKSSVPLEDTPRFMQGPGQLDIHRAIEEVRKLKAQK